MVRVMWQKKGKKRDSLRYPFYSHHLRGRSAFFPPRALYGFKAGVTFTNNKDAAMAANDLTIFVAFFGRSQ